MATTEELLQELVDLKKSEMLRERNLRITKFLLVTVPTFVVLVFTLWSMAFLMKKGMEFAEEFPSILEETASGQQDKFIESVKDSLPDFN